MKIRMLTLPALIGLMCVGSWQGPTRETDTSGPLKAQSTGGPDPVDVRCRWPSAPDTIREEGDAVLLIWRFQETDILSDFVVPQDSGYLAFRAAVRADEADVRRPVADDPEPRDEDEAAIWRDEDINFELAQNGTVGRIEKIRCLDALLFAFQNSRTPQVEHPTEFLASVLRRQVGGGSELAVVFGAGREMFVPKSVYGFDLASELVDEGWDYWYLVHNHTLQRNGDRLALGSPTLSTSDVHLVRNLAANRELRSARVTNGFFTFLVRAEDFSRMRSRQEPVPDLR